MDRDHFIEKITQKKRYIIDYANLVEKLFLYQTELIKGKKDLINFLKTPHKGLPIIIPYNLPYFKYDISQLKNYIITKLFLKKNFFRIKNLKLIYKPCDILLSSGRLFTNKIDGVIGKENIRLFNQIKFFNKKSKKKLQKIIIKHKKVCAFQTRNIPHLGHELIIDRLLKKFDHVVINPVIGPKKKGDIKYTILKRAFNFLIKKKYTAKKVSFVPVLANMYYAGPYEAIHHANIRSALGLKYFVIGRDHAGAQNIYKPEAAYKLANRHNKSIKMNIVTLKGSYYCKSCRKIIIKGDCNHRVLKNISGNDFRYHLLTKKIFKYANYEMQIYLKKFKNLFTK